MLGFIVEILLIPFYIIISLFGNLFSFLNKNVNFIPFAITIVIISFLYLFLGVNVINIMINDPFGFLLYFGVYVFIGLIWSFIKWYKFVDSKKEDIKDFFVKIRKDWEIESIKEIYDNDFEKYKIKMIKKSNKIPKAMDNKLYLINIMLYWPLSIVWDIFDNFILNLFSNIFKIFSKSYLNISKNIIKKYEKEIYG